MDVALASPYIFAADRENRLQVVKNESVVPNYLQSLEAGLQDGLPLITWMVGGTVMHTDFLLSGRCGDLEWEVPFVRLDDMSYKAMDSTPRGMPGSVIAFDLPRPCCVELTVYDIAGRVVRRLIDDGLGSGNHRLTRAGSDDEVKGVPAGTYILRLWTDQGARTTKVVLAK